MKGIIHVVNRTGHL